jgi:2-oxoglutarate dehydrogenase E2 component (dihydrolipoamide succinyltransferase)
MSKIDITIPSVGESITEATIEEWLKQSGDYVEKDEVIVTLETDKASVELVAEASGVLTTTAADGDTVEIGTVVGSIDSAAAKPAGDAATKAATSQSDAPTATAPTYSSTSQGVPGPAAKNILDQKGIAATSVQGTGPKGNITKADALNAQGASSAPSPKADNAPTPTFEVPTFASRGSRPEKMTTLRRKIAERLVSAQQTAAILTTFNEVDMTELMALRSEYKEAFEKRFGTRLGFMGFFVKAVCEALKDFPAVNGRIDGDHIIYNDFVNMGIAVGGPKGLVVPVVKDADLMAIHQIEGSIRNFAGKAKNNKLSMDDLTGGTFTISNGGVYGSLMSTPILNPPQSAILGMHAIQDRPMAINGEVKIRPMMYLALSYDHRIIDGKESVSFLVKVKQLLEDPRRLVLGV